MRTRAQHSSRSGPSLKIVFPVSTNPHHSLSSAHIDRYIVGTASLRVIPFHPRFFFFFARASIIINLRSRVFAPTRFSTSERRVTIFIATDIGASCRGEVHRFVPRLIKHIRYRGPRIEPSHTNRYAIV